VGAGTYRKMHSDESFDDRGAGDDDFGDDSLADEAWGGGGGGVDPMSKVRPRFRLATTAAAARRKIVPHSLRVQSQVVHNQPYDEAVALSEDDSVDSLASPNRGAAGATTAPAPAPAPAQESQNFQMHGEDSDSPDQSPEHAADASAVYPSAAAAAAAAGDDGGGGGGGDDDDDDDDDDARQHGACSAANRPTK
jgi:hypothetical protein